MATKASWVRPRDKQGKFLPQDAHPEDLKLPDHWDKLPADFEAYQMPVIRPVAAPKPRYRVVVGYVAYVIVCFVAGAVGALVGVHV